MVGACCDAGNIGNSFNDSSISRLKVPNGFLHGVRAARSPKQRVVVLAFAQRTCALPTVLLTRVRFDHI
jgi:hypothetical protein